MLIVVVNPVSRPSFSAVGAVKTPIIDDVVAEIHQSRCFVSSGAQASAGVVGENIVVPRSTPSAPQAAVAVLALFVNGVM